MWGYSWGYFRADSQNTPTAPQGDDDRLRQTLRLIGRGARSDRRGHVCHRKLAPIRAREARRSALRTGYPRAELGALHHEYFVQPA